MRLWHQSLIPKLPRQQLLGQHRECCALRGKGWGRKHATVDYVFEHDPAKLIAYHNLVMNEMKNRGYNPNEIWYKPQYRGSFLEEQDWCSLEDLDVLLNHNYIIYPEHNDEYLRECIENLKSKGVIIE